MVPLPVGTDPAELIQREGPEAMRAAVERSVPFVRFRVERVLAAGDDSSPEGRDRMVEELRPVFATLAPSAMRMELDADRLRSARAARRTLRSSLLASGAEALAEQGYLRQRLGRDAAGAGGRRSVWWSSRIERSRSRALSSHEDTERAFLALCIASPTDGADILANLDAEDLLLQRPFAARRAPSQPREPKEPLANWARRWREP